ncbi:MAG: AAA family ATPase [Longimicrobiales bacterium]
MSRTAPLWGRSRELGLLRGAFDARGPSMGWVVGLPGVGKTAVVRRAAADFRFLYHRAPPLSDPQQRAALADTLRGIGHPIIGEPSEGAPTWEVLFRAVADAAPEGRSTVLVVDDAHRWVESRARFEEPLREALARAVGRGVHVRMVAPEAGSPHGQEERLSPTLRIDPLSFRAALPFLPGATSSDRLRAYAVFGGLPGTLRLLDPGTTLATNLRRLVLHGDGPLRDAPVILLERYFQRPTRYAAILAALARGEGDWRAVQTGVPDLTSSGQAGPYLKRLEEVGLVEARRSLDASRNSRNRRYRLTDPFTAFWFRFVLPHREGLVGGGGDTACTEEIRLGLDSHVASVLPAVCRSFMAQDALEWIGANARECGSLWGPGYDISVSGVLVTGTPYYGRVIGEVPRDGPSPLEALDAEVRETRYGFGRERRLRVLFAGPKIPPSLLREVARREDVVLVRPDALAGWT